VTQITEASCHKLHHLRTRLRHLALDQQLHQEQNAIAFQHQRLLQVTSKRLSQGIQHCQLLKEKLNSLDPQKVLKRGYALVRSADGTIASSTENFASGEELQIQLGEGQVNVKIIEIVDT
ncbi:MAG: exodeoxyribonuclease VII large subunit, partial [Moorea sp. SIO4G2]|nr:exodeoxyribonuclease VII large subunit [Moorena sp. SIO4G2]